jgi:hypothetical protein
MRSHLLHSKRSNRNQGRVYRRVRSVLLALFYCFFGAPADEQLWARFVPMENGPSQKAERRMIIAVGRLAGDSFTSVN